MKYKQKINEIANNRKLFKTIEPEKVVIFNAKGKKEIGKLFEDIFNDCLISE